MDRRKFLNGALAVTALGGATFLVGCSPQSVTPAAANGAPIRNLKYITPFQHIVSHADVYVAIQQGYFEEAGLSIEPIGGSGTAASVSQVMAGQGMFGKAAAIITCPLIADKNTGMITIAQKDQVSQYSVASNPTNPLKHPRDWQGKSIGVISKGGSTELLLDAMTIAAGLDPKNVNKKVTGADVGSLEFFRKGEVDGFITFLGSETAFRQMNIDLHYLSTDEFAPMPGDSYFVEKSVAEQNEEAIVAFLRACRRGWEFMADSKNIDAVLSAVKKYNPIEVQDIALATAKVKGEVKLSTPPGGGAFLSMSRKTWEDGLTLMKKSLIIKNQSVTVDDVMTTKFIDQV